MTITLAAGGSGATACTHRPWCDTKSHEDYAAAIGQTVPCSSPVRVEVLDGRYRASAMIEATSQGVRVTLLDAPLYGSPLTPAGARQLAAMLTELAAQAEAS